MLVDNPCDSVLRVLPKVHVSVRPSTAQGHHFQWESCVLPWEEPLQGISCPNTHLTLWWWFSHSVMSDSCDPMDCGPSVSSVHGTLQVRTLEWVTMPSSRGSSQPRDGTQESRLSILPCRQILYPLSHLGSASLGSLVLLHQDAYSSMMWTGAKIK